MTTMTADERLALCTRLVDQLTRERTDAGQPLPFPASTANRPDAATTFGPDDPAGRTFAQQWHRFRALVNTREPATPPDGFTDAQDRLLRDLIADHGITDVATIPVTPTDPRIAVWRGDITTLTADAIVNAANSGMTGCWSPLHSCIDNAIHTFAGIRLRDECARYMAGRNWAPEPTGRAMVTDAYDLPARHVVHTVGPIANGRPTDEHRDRLASCYRSCLDAAARAGDRSIGLCCVGTGVFGFPQDQAADIATATVRDWLDRHADTPMRVVFVTFTERDEALYRRLFGAPARGAGSGHVPPAAGAPGSDAAIHHAHNVSLPDSPALPNGPTLPDEPALPDSSDLSNRPALFDRPVFPDTSDPADSTGSTIAPGSASPTDSANSDAAGHATPAGPADSGSAPYTRHTATDPLRSARDLLADADRVIIGAGAGLSTAAGLAYSGPRFERRFAAFIDRYGFSDMYSAGFHPFESLADYWAYWSLHIWTNRYEPGATPLYRTLAQWARERDAFVITTNVDAQFTLAGMPGERVFAPQGDYGLLQCSRGCHAETYDARATVEAMVDDTAMGRRTTLRDESLIPYCPRCGAPMAPHLRCDSTFVEGDAWHAASERYRRFVADAVDRGGEDTVLLELGVGWNTPVWIRYPFEQLACTTSARLIRLNMDPTTTRPMPGSPTHAPASAIQIAADIADALPALLR